MSTTARTAGGDLVLPRVIVTDFASCALQSIKDGLALWMGEWFLNQNEGFPWASILGVKTPDMTSLTALLRQFLLSVTGVISVQSTANYSGTSRNFSYNFTAFLSNGQQIVGGSGTPFVITGAQ